MICNHIPKWGTLINIFKPFLLFYLKKNFTFGKFWAYAKANRTVPITQSQNHQPMASSAPSSSLPTSPLFLSKCIIDFHVVDNTFKSIFYFKKWKYNNTCLNNQRETYIWKKFSFWVLLKEFSFCHCRWVTSHTSLNCQSGSYSTRPREWPEMDDHSPRSLLARRISADSSLIPAANMIFFCHKNTWFTPQYWVYSFIIKQTPCLSHINKLFTTG